MPCYGQNIGGGGGEGGDQGFLQDTSFNKTQIRFLAAKENLVHRSQSIAMFRLNSLLTDCAAFSLILRSSIKVWPVSRPQSKWSDASKVVLNFFNVGSHLFWHVEGGEELSISLWNFNCNKYPRAGFFSQKPEFCMNRPENLVRSRQYWGGGGRLPKNAKQLMF